MQYYDYGHFNQGDMNVLGDQDLWKSLENIIYAVPKDILDDALSNCAFLMISKEMRAGFILKKRIEGKCIIAFHDVLYEQTDEEKLKIFLHEIAHYFFGHSNEGLSDEDYYNHKQDKEANVLVDKWIDDWEKHLKTQEEKNSEKGGI